MHHETRPFGRHMIGRHRIRQGGRDTGLKEASGKAQQEKFLQVHDGEMREDGMDLF
jgi:hypothetical protein